MRRRFLCMVIRLLLLGPLFLAASVQAVDASTSSADFAQFTKTVQPFLNQYCFDCHDQTAKGDIRLDEFSDEHSLVDRLETVEQAANMIRRHAMPPRKKKQPD